MFKVMQSDRAQFARTFRSKAVWGGANKKCQICGTYFRTLSLHAKSCEFCKTPAHGAVNSVHPECLMAAG